MCSHSHYNVQSLSLQCVVTLTTMCNHSHYNVQSLSLQCAVTLTTMCNHSHYNVQSLTRMCSHSHYNVQSLALQCAVTLTIIRSFFSILVNQKGVTVISHPSRTFLELQRLLLPGTACYEGSKGPWSKSWLCWTSTMRTSFSHNFLLLPLQQASGLGCLRKNPELKLLPALSSPRYDSVTAPPHLEATQ